VLSLLAGAISHHPLEAALLLVPAVLIWCLVVLYAVDRLVQI
jgi:hypothetical protein